MNLSWHKYFLDIAKVVSTKSKDPKRQVGAIIVDEDNRVVSTGFNGYPKSYPDETVDWSNREQVRQCIIHAEANAILYARISLKNCKLYTTLCPCLDCAKMAAAAGMKEIYYLEDYDKNSIPDDYKNNLNMSIVKIIE